MRIPHPGNPVEEWSPMKSYSPSSLEATFATASPSDVYFSDTQGSTQKTPQSSMTIPFSELLASQTSDTVLTDRDEAYEEKSEKEVREKLQNLWMDDEKGNMDHDEKGGEGGHLSDHNQKGNTIKIVM